MERKFKEINFFRLLLEENEVKSFQFNQLLEIRLTFS